MIITISNSTYNKKAMPNLIDIAYLFLLEHLLRSILRLITALLILGICLRLILRRLP